MSFEAGAIEGGIKWNIGEYTGGMEHVTSLAEGFPELIAKTIDAPMFAAGGAMKAAIESAAGFAGPAGIMVAGFGAIATAAAGAAAEIFHMSSEVASGASQMDFAAQKAGVGIEFMSEWSEVAKRVGVDQNELGGAMKFLQRNAVEALKGNKELQEGFSELGISGQFLKTHLNDVGAIFEKVRDRMSGLHTQAQKTDVEMKLLGRMGSDLTPLFNLPTEKVQEYIRLAHEHGVVETAESAKIAHAWQNMQKNWHDMWEGFKKEHSEQFMSGILELTGNMDDELKRTAGDMDAASSGRGGGGRGGAGVNIENLNVDLHADNLAHEIADKLRPHLKRVLGDANERTMEAILRQKVAAATGGR